MPDRKLAIQLGGIRLDVALAKREKTLFQIIEQLLGRYAVGRGEAQCRIQITPFSYSASYRWNPSELSRLQRLFTVIHNRCPTGIAPVQAATESVNMLRHCDPADPAVRQMRSGLKRPSVLMHAAAASDLLFYNPRTDIAGALLKIRARRSLMLPGVANAVMWALSYRLLQQQGLLLHGCGIRKNGRSMLFLGRSGDGKSTVARLINPDLCFSDDGVIVRKSAGRFRIYPSPFRQITAGDDPSSAPGEIEGLFLLEKSDRNEVLPLRKSALMHIVLSELIHFFKYMNRESAEKGFETLREMVTQLPVFRLRFAKSGKVWDNVSGL